MLRPLATAIVARPRAVLAVTVLFLVLAGVFGAGAGDRLKAGGFDDPGSESAAAARVLDERFGDSANRAVLVPAIMQFAGECNWWAPRPLRRLHARIGLGEARRWSAVRRPVTLTAAESGLRR